MPQDVKDISHYPSYLKFLVALAIITVSGACSRLPERKWERGYFEPIDGKPFRLPDGLVVRRIVGAEEEIPTSHLPLALTVLNNNNRRVSVIMPPGLVFDPLDHEYQYMMLLQEFGFSVPSSQDTTIMLPTYCANENLDEPDSEASYEIAIQVWERELHELFDLLKGKRLDYEAAVELAQEALFEITDREGLTDSTRQKIKQLP